MSMADPIADMLTQIRNGLQVHKKHVTFPGSKLKLSILSVLKEEGYIVDYSESVENNKSTINVDLKYYEGAPVIDSIKRVSRPGRRVYRSSSDLPLVNNGLGIAIVSTSKGIMIERKAKEQGIGGELICTVN